MLMQKTMSIFLTSVLALQAGPAMAASNSQSDCAVTKQMSMSENDSYMMFNARLSHLQYDFGKPNFEEKLSSIVQNFYPTAKVIQVSPVYYEKVANLIDQARLRNLIAKTVGLDSDVWSRFERIMKDITLMGSMGYDLSNPLDKTAINLLNAIAKSKAAEDVKVDAVARVSAMNAYILKWRVNNGEIIDEQASVEAKKVAMVGVGIVGAGVLCSTLVVSAPIVSGAGAMAAGLSSSAVTSALLIKLAETAAGAAIGFVGAPAAVLTQQSYHALTEGYKQSANNQTNLACELQKQNQAWRAKAGGTLLSAALVGSEMGMFGGLMTFSSATAKAVLYVTGAGVGVAQLYSVGSLGSSAVRSVAFFKMAEDAEQKGNHDEALKYLFHARDLAQEAGEAGLEAIIIGTLSYHVSAHFAHALHEGASAIRQLYAASADTLPTAAKAAKDMIGGVVNGSDYVNDKTKSH